MGGQVARRFLSANNHHLVLTLWLDSVVQRPGAGPGSRSGVRAAFSFDTGGRYYSGWQVVGAWQ